ncbi:M23 family metallopeptidase [Mycolicibacillus parakoreensis]|uniref:M23 family metallopeptidase n=1 Tax=Mycolicibacillus parakoreensis TaxID=1069221 RepID=A0ABY3U918_9MYCO|nr:M23 family metallopeptidase [Mycolicibacillus parakoreensis]ULN54446.1 M23 family metallopeptidase [Mycolicibacillus parakoreensis]
MRDRFAPPPANDVTDIIPIDEFLAGFEALAAADAAWQDADLDTAPDGIDTPDTPADHADGGFESEWLLDAPELDDLHSTDDLSATELIARADDDTATVAMSTCGGPARRRGGHRRSTAGASRGRVLIGAMAVGAVAAAAHTTFDRAEPAESQPVLVAEEAPLQHTGESAAPRGMQVISVKPAATFAVHDEEFAKGVAYAQERAEREARLQRPLFVAPTTGIFTSNFGYRWGSLHAGIDIANSIGTPILAASDGVVIEAGSAAGYGALVKLRHSDGTVTLYGHINTWTVDVGDRVMAGDQIATMGNRGFSTGPHCHFEVLLNGTSRVDPLPWLAQRGINIGNFAG